MTDLEYAELALKYYGDYIQEVYRFAELVKMGKEIEEFEEPNDKFD